MILCYWCCDYHSPHYAQEMHATVEEAHCALCWVVGGGFSWTEGPSLEQFA